jgi:thiol:disulfide interchange protein DsbD
MKPKWHIYWRNPGDSGLQTQIELESDGLKFEEILWPTPEKIPFDGMANFGYENSVTLFVPFELESIKSEYKIKSNISWLVCKESCIPQDTSFEFSIKSGKNPKKNDLMANFFDKTIKSMPKLKNIKVSSIKDQDSIKLTLDKFKIPKEFTIEFFPFVPGLFNNGAIQRVEHGSNFVNLNLPLDIYRFEEPKNVNGLIVIYSEKELFNSFEINSTID